MIHVAQLSVRYYSRRRPAVRSVDLHIHDGESVLLLGPSGCGKSTLALTLNGLIPHSLEAELRGSVQLDGFDTQHTPLAQLTQRAGIVFQDPESQFITLNVEDEIAFGLENLCLPPAEIHHRIGEALNAVRLAHLRHAPVWALSGGQKQRVALASLLAMRPPTLIFDEPTANLDPLGAHEVFEQIAALRRSGQHTLVLIEHRLDALMDSIDRVIVLEDDGQPVLDGAPSAVFAHAHAGTLQRLGVWVPQVSLLAHRVGLQHTPVTLEQALPMLAARLKSAPRNGKPRTTAPTQIKGRVAVRVQGLSYAYGDRAVLRDVHLDVHEGECLAIVGANGAGKTTLARHMAGIVTPPPGTVFVRGLDVSRTPAAQLMRHVGFVFQNPEHQFVSNSVADELRYSLRHAQHPPSQIESQVEALLARFKLQRYAHVNPFMLSHGEKRRLSVAAILATARDVLILDEPTFGQDQHTAQTLMQMLRDLQREGHTIIFTTHDMTLVAEYADRVAVLKEGQVIFHDTPRALFRQPALLRQAHLDMPPLCQLAHALHVDAMTFDDWLHVLKEVEVAAP